MLSDHSRRVTSRAQYLSWLATAHKGDRCTYWVGHLTVDRVAMADRTPSELGGEAWRSYKDGSVVLVQKKLDAGLFRYMAVRR